jgi:hypothetical protein
VQSAVFFSIIEHLFDLFANNKMVVGIDRCIARIENAVDVLPEKNSV